MAQFRSLDKLNPLLKAFRSNPENRKLIAEFSSEIFGINKRLFLEVNEKISENSLEEINKMSDEDAYSLLFQVVMSMAAVIGAEVIVNYMGEKVEW